MKLILFVALGYFCFNLVILASSVEIERANITDEIFKSKEVSFMRKMKFKHKFAFVRI